MGMFFLNPFIMNLNVSFFVFIVVSFYLDSSVAGYLVELDSVWRFSRTEQPDPMWTSISFIDSMWEDMIPIADSIVSSSTTIYMRHVFEGMDDVDVFELHLSYSCGIIVYLNNERIYHDHLPSGIVLFNTSATICEFKSISLIQPGSLIHSGKMAIAVEHHYTSVMQWTLTNYSLWLSPLSTVDDLREGNE